VAFLRTYRYRLASSLPSCRLFTNPDCTISAVSEFAWTMPLTE
jgi:hypothetical protein